jgi:hypothetical protein
VTQPLTNSSLTDLDIPSSLVDPGSTARGLNIRPNVFGLVVCVLLVLVFVSTVRS